MSRRNFLIHFVSLAMAMVLGMSMLTHAQESDLGPVWHVGGWKSAVAAHGEHLYFGHTNALAIARIDQDRIQQIGSIILKFTPDLIKIFDNTIYMAFDNEIKFYSLTDSLRPKMTGGASFNTADDKILDFCVQGQVIYFAIFNSKTKTGAFRVYDLTDPANPVSGKVNIPCQSVEVRDQTAYVITGHSSVNATGIYLRSYDVSDPANITEKSALKTSGAEYVYLHNNLAFTGGSGQSHLCIFDISDPGNLKLLSDQVGGSPLRRVVVRGSYAYAATWTDLQTFDISNPSAPVLLDEQDLGGLTILTLDLLAERNQLMVFQGTDIKLLDLADVQKPAAAVTLQHANFISSVAVHGDNVLVADVARIWRFDWTQNGRQSLYIEGSCNKIYVHDTWLCVTGAGSGFSLYDILDIENPVKRGTFPSSYNIMEMAFQDSLAFVLAASLTNGEHQVEIVDISNPDAPVMVGRISLPGVGIDVKVSENGASLLYAAFFDPNGQSHGFAIFDVSEPSQPKPVQTVTSEGKPTALWVDGPLLLLSTITAQEDGWYLQAYDVSDPQNPVLIAETQDLQSKSPMWDLSLAGSTIYAACDNQGVLGFALAPVGALAKSSGSASGLPWAFTAVSASAAVQYAISVTAQTLPGGHSNSVYASQGYLKYGQPYSKGGDGLKKLDEPLLEDPPRPPQIVELMMHISPAEAAAYCSVSPGVGPHRYLKNRTIDLQASADPASGWVFKEWQGAASSSISPTALQMDSDKQVTAVFVDVRLLVSGGKPRRDLCPFDVLDSNRLEMTPISFCASEADDWLLGKFSLRASGTGDEVRDIKKVYVYSGSTVMFSDSYGMDDGILDIKFEPALVIGAGTCRSFQISYEFGFDPQIFAADTLKTFAVESFGVAAEPVHFEIGTIEGQAKCDTLTIARVFNSSGDAFASIQDAVSSATTQPGDSVFVCGGNYLENVQVDKSLTIFSSAGSKKTEVRGGDQENVFEITADDVTIQGLTVASTASAQKQAPPQIIASPAIFDLEKWDRSSQKIAVSDTISGWGIWTRNGIRLVDVVVASNRHGGIMALEGGVSGLDIEVAGNGGNGIVAFEDEDIWLTNAIVRFNQGVGVGNAGEGEIHLTGEHNLITDNRDHGLHSFFGDITIKGSGCEIHGNGGWGIQAVQGEIVIEDGALSSVHKNGRGGIMAYKDLSLPRKFIVQDNGGPGIVCFGEYGIDLNNPSANLPLLLLEDIQVRNNQGDGISSVSMNLMLRGSDNQVVENDGHGLRLFAGDIEIEGTGCQIHHNGGWGMQALLGGIHVDDGALGSVSNNGAGGLFVGRDLSLPAGFMVEHNGGPGIASMAKETVLTDIKVRYNSSDGIHARSLYLYGRDNEVSTNGGWGIRVEELDGEFVIGDGAWVRFNRTGGIRVIGSSVQMNNTLVLANRGHGILAASTPGVEIRNSRINHNYGYGLVVIDSPVNIQGVTFVENIQGATNFLGYESSSAPNLLMAANGEKADLNRKRMTPSPRNARAAEFQSLIAKCVLERNGGDAIRFEGGIAPHITMNNFFANQGYGINSAQSAVTLNALGNWWGEASGPGGSGPGNGDKVDGQVNFVDWRTSPVSVVVSFSVDTLFVPRGEIDTVRCFFQNWENARDGLTVQVSADDASWLISSAAFSVTLADSMGAQAALAFAIPANVPAGAFSKVKVRASSQTDPAAVDVDSFYVYPYRRFLSRLELDHGCRITQSRDWPEVFGSWL